MHSKKPHVWIAAFCLFATIAVGSVMLFRYAFASDGSGTNVVSPTDVTAGSTGNAPAFTFTAAENMSSGEIAVTVPAGWSAPQGTPGTAGYVTAVSGSGVIADVLNRLEDATGWSATQHMALSTDTGDKQEGTGSLLNTIGATAAANEQWYFNYGAVSNWGTVATDNARVGMWVKSSVNTASGDISWQDDDSADLASPLDTVALPALTANTWTYTSATLGATSRTSILSYGFRYTNDVGAAAVRTDSLSKIFSANDVTTGWASDGSITLSALTTSGNFKEGTGSVRCSYAAAAGIGASGDCFDNEASVIVLGPGTTVSLWVRSSVALNAGDFAFTTDNSNNMASPEDVVSLPALAANTWTYLTLSAANSGDARSFGVRQLVDKGAMTIDLDAFGKQIDASDSTTGWAAPTATVQALSSDATTLHEGSASLKNVIAASAAVGDRWYQTLSPSRDWTSYTTVGFWIRSTVATTAGQLKFEYSTTTDLSSPIASVNVGALAANTWTYQTFALSGTRATVQSYGINYAADIGAATVNLDGALIGPGVPTFPGGGVISVRLLSLTTGQTAVITYGSGGGASGAVAPTLSGISTFTTQSRVSDAGSLQTISSSPTITVNPAATSQFALNDPGDITAGTRAAYTVTRKDSYGNLVTSGTQTVYLYSDSTGNKAFYAVESGGSPVASVTIADGASSAAFWYYDDKAGSFTVTVSDNATAPDGAGGIADATDGIAVSAASVSQFRLSDPGGMVAGTRLGYTVTRKDAFGNAVTTGSQTVYLYSNSSGNEAFYAGESGGSPITSIAIADASSAATFWYEDDKAGTFAVTASDNASAPDGLAGIDDAQDAVTVSAAATSQFLLTDPGDMTAGTRLGYSVSRKDAFGNFVTSGTQTVYLYSDSTGNKAFYAASSGGSPVSSVTIADASATADVWYEDDKAGTFGVTASDNSVAPDGAAGIADATDSVTVSAAATSQFLLNDPGDMTAGTRLGYTVTRRDSFGNDVVSGSQTVYLYSNSSNSPAFYAVESGGSPVASVVIANASSSANFWYYDEAAGSASVTASDNASAPDGADGIDDATDGVTVTQGSTTQFLLNDPGGMTAGTRLGYSVSRKDSYGNLVTSGTQTVYLYSDSTGNKAFYAVESGGSPVASVVIADGASAASVWYEDDKAGSFAVTASDNASAPDGTTGIDDATDSVAVSAASTSRFLLDDPGDMVAGTRLGYAVSREDAFGNAVTAGADTVYLYSNSTGNEAFYEASSGGSPVASVTIADASSSVAFWYEDDKAGSFVVTASDNASAPDGAAGIDDATDSVSISSAATARFLLNEPGDVTAGMRLGYVVSREDAFGNAVTTGADTAYLYSDSSNSPAFYAEMSGGSPVASVTIANASSSANFWYYDEAAGTATVTASDNASAPDGAAGIDDATDSVTVTQAPVSRFVLSDPGDMTAGTRLGYAVTRRDAFGNAVTTGADTVYLYSDSAGTKTFYDASSGGSEVSSVTIAEGFSSVSFWYYDEKAGSANVTASDNASAPDGDVAIDDATDGVVVNAAATAQFSLSDPGDMTAGTRLGYTVTRTDAFGNAVSSGSQAVYPTSSSAGSPAFYAASSGGSPVSSVFIDDGSSTVDFWFYDERAGTSVVTASDNASAPDGAAGIDDATDSVTVTAAATRQFLLNDPGDMVAGTRLGYVVSREDQFGNPVDSGTDTAYLYSNSSNNPKFYAEEVGGSPITSVTIAGPSASATFWYADEAAGTVTVTASDNAVAPDGLAGIDDASDDVVVSGAPTARFALNDPGNMVAGARLGYVVTRSDAFDNAVTTGVDTAYLTSDSTGNAAFYDAASGGNEITSVDILGGSSSATFWYEDDKAGSFSVTASDNATAPDGAAGIDDATDAVTVSPAATARFLLNDPGNVTAGERLGYTVSREDAFGNVVTTGTDTVYPYSDSLNSPAFYAASSGGSPVASVTISDGNASAGFWYYDEAAGSATVTASDNATAPDGAAGIDDATDDVVVSDASVSRFLLTDPGDAFVGTRIGYVVSRADAFGNAATSGTDTAYLYSDSTGNAVFYDAESGGNQITSIAIENGNSTAAFWYADDRVATVNVTVSDNATAPDGADGIDDATDAVDVTIAPASRFTIVPPSATAVGELMTVTIRAEDAFGNLDSTYQGDVTLVASGSATGAGLVDVVDGIGTTEISDVIVETVQLTLDDTEGTGLDVTATVDATFTTGPTRAFDLTDPGDMTAGTRIAYVVTRRDSFGNLVTAGSDTAYLFGDATAAFYDAAENGSQVTSVSIGSGASSATFWYQNETAGTFTVFASDNASSPDGLAGIDDAQDDVTVSPGPVSRFLLNDPGDTVAGSRVGYVVSREDQYGNPATSGDTHVRLYTDSAGPAAFYNAGTDGTVITSLIITDGNADGSFWYADERAGTVSVTVSDDPTAPDGMDGVDDASDTLVVSAGLTYRYVLDNPGDITVDTSVGYTVTRKDEFGNLVTNGEEYPLLYSDSIGAYAFFDAAVEGNRIDTVTFNDGQSSAAFWYYDDAGGVWTVTASDNAFAPDGPAGIIDGTDLIEVTTIPIVATRVVILNPTDATVGDSVPVTLRAVDDFGSVDTTFAGTVTLERTGSATGAETVSFAAGVGTVEISDTVAETVVLTLNDTAGTGLNMDSSQDIVFAPGPTSVYTLNDPGDTTAGTRIGYVLTRTDAYGNLVVDGSEAADLLSAAEGSATFYEASSGGSQISSVTIANGSSTAEFWYANEQAVSETITVSGTDTVSDDIVVAPGPTARYVLNDPGDMSTGTRLGYEVSRTDAFGNAVTAGTETVGLFTSSTGAAAFYDAPAGGNVTTSVVFGEGDSSKAFWYFDDTDGVWLITVSDGSPYPDGDEGVDDGSDPVTVTTIPISVTRFTIVDPSNGTVGGSVTVTIRAEDDFGSVDTTFQGRVSLVVSGSATGGGTVTFVNGIGTATVSDTVEEAVTLSLIDSDATGFDVSSVQNVSFDVSGGGGATVSEPEPAPAPVIPTVLRFEGRAYPGALATLLGHTATESISLAQTTAAASGAFALSYEGPFDRLVSYEVVVTDAEGVTAPGISFEPSIPAETTTTLTLIAPPTVHLFQRSVLRGNALSVSGFAEPGSTVELTVDAAEISQTVKTKDDGSYKLFLDTASMAFGLYVLHVRAILTDGQTVDAPNPGNILVSSVLNAGTDLNGDGIVNITDWSVFLVQWGSPDPAVRAPLDFNRDGVVDISDFSVFIRSIRH